jgi:hypothetical protein
MRRAPWGTIAVACAALLSAVTFVNAAPGNGQARAGERLFFTGKQSVATLESAAVGQGIDGLETKEKAVGREARLVWRKQSENLDELGMRHVSYAQAIKVTGRLASLLDPEYVSKGIRVEGGDVGLHFQADGTQRAVFGRQHATIELANEPLIGDAKQAWQVAQGVVAGYPGFDAGGQAEWSADQIEDQR